MRWETIFPQRSDARASTGNQPVVNYKHGFLSPIYMVILRIPPPCWDADFFLWKHQGWEWEAHPPCHHPICGESFGSRKKCLNPSLTTRWSGKIWKRSARMWRNAGVTVGRLERCPQCCVSCGMVCCKGCLSCSEALLSQRLFQNFAPDECFVWPLGQRDSILVLDCTYRKIPDGLDQLLLVAMVL